MPQVSFNAQALGIARYEKDSDVSHAVSRSALQPVMVCRPGVEAITEGLRLANIKGLEIPSGKPLAGDIDP